MRWSVGFLDRLLGLEAFRIRSCTSPSFDGFFLGGLREVFGMGLRGLVCAEAEDDGPARLVVGGECQGAAVLCEVDPVLFALLFAGALG
jgi:hypothetical protein